MSKPKLSIIVLVVALVVSNAWWAYRLLDAGVTHTYMAVSLTDNKEALSQTLALLPVVASPSVSRAEVIAAAKLPGDELPSFEKDGFVWVGKIGLRFNEKGRLIAAARAWSPE